jgi:hypothetical protein
MLDNIKLDRILFLDIETVPASAQYQKLSDEFKEFWDKKSIPFRKEDQNAEEVYQRAGIYAEFGKIICISFGMINYRDKTRNLRIKSIYNDDEKLILLEFSELLKKLNKKGDLLLCAHNGKEFDFPYIARRMLINKITLPAVLDVAGLKPWETKFLDTLELWKFGDYKHYTSLNLLTHLLGIPSPKTDLDGSKVAIVYYNDHDLERISRYCQSDVVAVVQLILSYKGEELIKKENIERVEN